MMQENNSTQWILGGALLLIGLFVIIALVLTRSQAADTTVDVQNAAPTVSVKLCPDDTTPTFAEAGACTHITSLTPLSGPADTFLDIVIDVTDTNGTADIDNATVKATLVRSGITSAACVAGGADNNNCYRQIACTALGDSGGTLRRFNCDVAVKYWIDPTSASAEHYSSNTWITRGDASDLTPTSAFAEMTNTEVQENQSVGLSTSTINYGSRALGFASDATNTVEITGTNLGNVDADAQIKADTDGTHPAGELSCVANGGLGVIAASAQKFGTADVAHASLTTTMSTSFQDINFEDTAAVGSLKCRTSEGTPVTDIAYFGIAIPASGVRGTCSNTATVTSIIQKYDGVTVGNADCDA